MIHSTLPCLVVLTTVWCGASLLAQRGGGGGGSSLDDPAIVLMRSSDIYVMDADGTGATRIVRRVGATEPVWSPDGNQIAFGSGNGIWVANRNGSGLRQVVGQTTDVWPCVAWSPTQAPGGSFKLAYLDVPPGRQSYEVILINTDGSGRQQLTDTAEVDEMWVCWSPDATKLAVTTWDVDWNDANTLDVIALGLDAAGAITVTSRSTICSDPTLATWFETPAWSVGNVLAYAVRAFPGGQATIETVALSTPSTRRLLGPGARPSWAPNGTQLVFFDAGFVLSMDADGARRTVLAAGTYPHRRHF